MSHRDWCFTAFDTIEYDEKFIKYICWGIEICPDTGREHKQGFVVLTKTARMPQVKRILGSDSVHIEPRRGTKEQARDYCFKEDGEKFEFGTFEALTKEELFKKPKAFIVENYPEFYCRFHRVINENQPKGDKWRDVHVEWIWGEPGTGKTRQVMELDSVFKLDYPYTWFDGYCGEDILLIDDYEEGAIRRGHLLNLLDGYRQRLETKGGHTWALWTKVYITSNRNPEKFWCNALKRRVTVCRRAG